jgi:hypothetical protein
MSYDIKYWIFVIDFLLVGHFTLFSLLWGGFFACHVCMDLGFL